MAPVQSPLLDKVGNRVLGVCLPGAKSTVGFLLLNLRPGEELLRAVPAGGHSTAMNLVLRWGAPVPHMVVGEAGRVPAMGGYWRGDYAEEWDG